MTHVFVAPHPDDVALSCGGLIASLRELGQNVTIVTVFSGAGGQAALTPYQREALGFGTKAIWPSTEAFNRANVAADRPIEPTALPYLADAGRLEATQAEADASAKRFWQRSSWYRRADVRARPGGAVASPDEVAQQGALLTDELVAARSAGDVSASRRLEDEHFAYLAEASIVWLDLPDAVFRGYEGDAELLGDPRPDDPAPAEVLAREIVRLEPQRVYLPLGVGGHVDHQLVRSAGIELLARDRDWVMPGPDYAGTLAFYEDFPYAWWSGFARLEELPTSALAGIPAGVGIGPEYAAIGDTIDFKIQGIGLYASQLDNLFGGAAAMADAVRAFGRSVAGLGGLPGYAERYWVTARL